MTKKSTKRANKPAQDISVHIAFQDVNSGINKLIAARTFVSRDRKSGSGFGFGQSSTPMRGLNHTDTKAIDIQVKPKDRASAFEARMEAVKTFLKKAKPEDRITLATNDADFLKIVNESDPAASKASRKWQKFSKDLNIEVVDLSGEFSAPDDAFEDEGLSDMDLALRHVAFRVNKLTRADSGIKGYVNSPASTR